MAEAVKYRFPPKGSRKMILTASRTQDHRMGYDPIRAGFQPPFPAGPFDSASGCMVERRGAGFSGIPPLKMGWPCGGLTSRMRLRSVTTHIPWASRSSCAATGAGCAGGGDDPGNLYTGQRQVGPGGEAGHASKSARSSMERAPHCGCGDWRFKSSRAQRGNT